jgi:hypothetical protein
LNYVSPLCCGVYTGENKADIVAIVGSGNLKNKKFYIEIVSPSDLMAV